MSQNSEKVKKYLLFFLLFFAFLFSYRNQSLLDSLSTCVRRSCGHHIIINLSTYTPRATKSYTMVTVALTNTFLPARSALRRGAISRRAPPLCRVAVVKPAACARDESDVSSSRAFGAARFAAALASAAVLTSAAPVVGPAESILVSHASLPSLIAYYSPASQRSLVQYHPSSKYPNWPKKKSASFGGEGSRERQNKKISFFSS